MLLLSAACESEVRLMRRKSLNSQVTFLSVSTSHIFFSLHRLTEEKYVSLMMTRDFAALSLDVASFHKHVPFQHPQIQALSKAHRWIWNS